MGIFKHRFIFHWIVWLLLFMLFAVCAAIIILTVQDQEYMREAKKKRDRSTEVYSHKKLMIKVLKDNNSCILLEATNKKGQKQVKTGASIYLRYSIKILSENCFILLSSDIGDTFFLYDDGWQDFPVRIFPSPSNKYIAYVLDYKKNDVIDLLSQKNLYFLLVCNEQGNVVFYKSISIGDVANSIVWKGNTSLEINAKAKQCIDLCDIDYCCVIEDIIKQISKTISIRY